MLRIEFKAGGDFVDRLEELSTTMKISKADVIMAAIDTLEMIAAADREGKAITFVNKNPPLVFNNEQDDLYHKKKIMELVHRHNLGFLGNPGGGQFLNASKNIDIQVSDCDFKEDYEQLLAGLRKLALEPEGEP
jgi:hypothetical protein